MNRLAGVRRRTISRVAAAWIVVGKALVATLLLGFGPAVTGS